MTLVAVARARPREAQPTLRITGMNACCFATFPSFASFVKKD
jgi:hypothetical protein